MGNCEKCAEFRKRSQGNRDRLPYLALPELGMSCHATFNRVTVLKLQQIMSAGL